MTEFDYHIVVGCDRDEIQARKMLEDAVKDFQRLGFEATGNLIIRTKRYWFFKLYFYYQPVVKKAKIIGVNC